MTQKLYRSKSDAMVGGVAAGIAEYFGVDPSLVRIAWLILLLVGGTGFWLYVIAWIVIPASPTGEPTPNFRKTEQWRESVVSAAKDVERSFKSSAGDESTAYSPDAEADSDSHRPDSHTDPDTEVRRRQFFGWGLVVFGAVLLFNNLMPWFPIARFWPVILILVGVLFVLRETRN